MVMRIVCLSLGMLLSIFSGALHAQESLCAEVKIEILQQVSLERQGFEALMRITNTLDTFSLENISVTVNFTDADGKPVVATSDTSSTTAAFFIRVDGTRDVTGFTEGANGVIQGGTIAPKKVGEMRWLIIPTAKAAGQTKDGKLYYVGAQLKYSYGGKDEVVDVAADFITVKPQPALTLDYFLTQEIVGDDAFTPAIEPAEPYTLGVRISNNGFGFAKSVKIESAQPKIVENKQNLAVGFKILGSYVEDQPASPSLLINFGNIEPKGTTTGRWIMETNMSGKFTSFTASFTHADELGGSLTSLLQATNANFLIRDVLVDLPGRDNLRDFLAYNAQNEVYVFESENTGLNAATCTNCQSVHKVDAQLDAGNGITSRFTHFPQAGLSYASAIDPFAGKKVLVKAVRDDGTSVHPQNVWLSKKRAADKIHFDYLINIFDNNSVGSYTLYWGVNLADLPQPPVIQLIEDKVTYEGGTLGFIVQATDPNNTIPNLSIEQLPAGASFTLSAPNQGVFAWSPRVGQVGTYPITFTATDGSLNASRSLIIRVNPAHDTDGDGMDDDWERKHFGDLSHDGTADSDNDGRSDLQEFTDKTDPKIVDAVPVAPQILSPIFNSDTLQGSSLPLQPTLAVTNGHHPTNVGAVVIVYEIYSDESLTNLIATKTVDEGISTTSAQITPTHMIDGASFEDNHLYYWRAKSQQKTGAATSSAWVKSSFFINTANDVPSIPRISNPAINSIVADVSPVLAVTNSTDIDRDSLSYSFSIYAENNLGVPVATVSNINPSVDGQTYWHLPVALQEDTRYQWQATVSDGHGGNVMSEWGSFLVSLVNNAPTIPQIDSPANGAVIQKSQGDNNLPLVVLNSTDPERATVTYYFELDTVNTFDSADKRVSSALAAGSQGKTTWVVDNLIDKQVYFWRVRAFDGSVYSDWNLSQFTFSRINQPPSVPTVHNPANAAIINTLLPLLEMNPSVDPEGKAVTYRFQLFADAQMGTLINEKTFVNPLWQLDFNLADKATYYWRVRAEDADSLASAWSDLISFTIKLPVVNEKPQLSFVLPNTDKTAESAGVLIQWTDSDSDSDAIIDLFVTDANGTKTMIAHQLDENADSEADQYIWNTTGVAPGTYKISAEISDEVNVVTANACCTVTVPQPQLNLLPISSWSFEENSGTQTLSSVGNVSALFKVSAINTPTTALPLWIKGRNNSVAAIAFDGIGSYLELPKTATAPLLGTASMSFWVNTTTMGAAIANNSPAIIGDVLSASRNDIKWGSIDSFGSIGFAIGNTRLLSSTPIANGQWHHVVITRDVSPGTTNGLVKIYIDGVLNALGSPNDPAFTALKNGLVGFGVNIGTTGTNNVFVKDSKFFKGSLDDVQIFNRVLSAAEVASLYQSQSGVAPAAGDIIGVNGIYQAEAATVYLGQVAKNASGYTGTAFVDYDAAVNSYVEWTVERPVSGNVTLQFRYANGAAADRPMSISVNGVVVNSALSFPFTTNWNTWGVSSLVVNLNQGINTIRATSNNSIGGPNVDYLKIQ